MSKFNEQSLTSTKIVKANKIYYNNVFYSWDIVLKYNKYLYNFQLFLNENSNFDDISEELYNIMFNVIEIKTTNTKRIKLTKGISNKYLNAPEVIPFDPPNNGGDEGGGDEEPPVEPMF